MSDFSSAKSEFLASVATDEHMFVSTLAFIEHSYNFTPTALCNGDVANSAGQNQGQN
jgi:hypothetical protein